APAQRQSRFHKQLHGNRRGMPAAGGQAAEQRRFRRLLIEMKRLRVELRGKCLDFPLVHRVRGARKALAYVQILKKEPIPRRLDALIDAGLLQRRQYSEHPPRYEYVPTACGRDFAPILVGLLAWGNKHFAPEGASVLLVNANTGKTVDPILVDRATGRPIDD